MYGLVLWSDPEHRQAVIWCEDHGDLAFFRADPDRDNHALRAGDLISCVPERSGGLRLVRAFELVTAGHRPDLGEALRSSGGAPPPRSATDIDKA